MGAGADVRLSKRWMIGTLVMVMVTNCFTFTEYCIPSAIAGESVCSVLGGVELLTSQILIPACAEQKRSSTSRKCPVFILSTVVSR